MPSDSWEQLYTDVVNCRACPRLVAWREEVAQVKRRAYQDWDYWGRPVTGFGDPKAALLLVGLAPAAHGANRTGRAFTGDSSGDTLYAALYRAGFASQSTSERPGDGLALRDAYITGACRCAPPGNRPTPEELQQCRSFLLREMALLSQVRIVLALGRIGFESYLQALHLQGAPLPRLPFRHSGIYWLGDAYPAVVTTYHPSRQNTNTGRLTEEMLDQVLGKARAMVEAGRM